MTDLKKGVLLLVDDEVDLLHVYTDLLSSIASEIVTALNGQEALELIKTRRIDAVLTDIKMPIMTGLELLEQVRALGLHVPIVVVTGYGGIENAKEALRLDATDLIDKPFDNQQLLSVMKKALDLGVIVSEYERALDVVFANTNLSDDEVNSIKKIRKIIATMKATTAVYIPSMQKK